MIKVSSSNNPAFKRALTVCSNHIKPHATLAKSKTCGIATINDKGEEVSDKLEDTVRHAAGTAKKLQQYMLTNYNWTETTIEEIDWIINGKVFLDLTKTGYKHALNSSTSGCR
jgi:hypothetical protein